MCIRDSIVVVEIVNELGFEVFQGVEILKVKQFCFEQAEEVLHHGIVQSVAFPAHALPDALVFQHLRYRVSSPDFVLSCNFSVA